MSLPDNIPEEIRPLYQKGLEIYDTVHRIGELIPPEDEHLNMVKDQMSADALTLSSKVAAVAMMDYYDMKMEAATLIRKSARDLMVQNHALEMYGFKEVVYFQLVRDQIEEYRHLFIDWVRTFDPWDYEIDRWGLFNPPGVSPLNHDPDEDLPRDTDS